MVIFVIKYGVSKRVSHALVREANGKLIDLIIPEAAGRSALKGRAVVEQVSVEVEAHIGL